jgi:hypothetical protein
MKANPSPMSVADYCHAVNAGKITVNKDYQRNTGLWTAQARSFFIESILLQFPIPKLYLYAKLDLKSRQQVKEVVDGQQRTEALVSFFNNTHKLTSNVDSVELRGLRYNQLTEDWQEKFLSYNLPIDQFSGAPEDEVREAFRRMNANNVPLNDEEQRNARYQGPFKWFIVKIADKYQNALGSIGLFSRRDLIRMADLKAYAEIVLVLDNGFSTVKAKQIDDLYKKYNASFPLEDELFSTIASSVDEFLRRQEWHEKQILRPHVFQSAILALISLKDPSRLSLPEDDKYSDIAERAQSKGFPVSVLVAAMKTPDDYPDLKEFVDACSKKTNVQESKVIRYIYLREALSRAS